MNKCSKCGKEPTGGFMDFVVPCAICGKPICDRCGEWPVDDGFRCRDHTEAEIKEAEDEAKE